MHCNVWRDKKNYVVQIYVTGAWHIIIRIYKSHAKICRFTVQQLIFIHLLYDH